MPRNESATSSRATRWSSWFAIVVPALSFLYAGWERRWAGDDGFINTRVVAQLLDGNGFVFNAGERSEAVTSALWVLILWALGELGIDVDDAGLYAALAFSLLGMLGAGFAAVRTSRLADDERPSIILPLGLLGYAAIPVAWDYATSLLENGLGLAYLGGCYWLLARATTGALAPPRWLVGACVGLAPLVRPDFALYALPWTLILLFGEASWRERIRVALCTALPAAAFEVFRMGYFAALVPNTALAKEAFAARWDQGLFYLTNTFGTYGLWFPLAVAVLALVATVVGPWRGGVRAPSLVSLALAGSGALHILYVVRVGGDFMHGRMLLPGLFAIFASVAVIRVRWGAWLEAGAGALACAGVLCWALLCASSYRVPIYEHEILDERLWWSNEAHQAHPTRLRDYEQHKFYQRTAWVKSKIAENCPGGMASLGDDIGDFCKRMAWRDMMDGELSDHPEEGFLPLNPAAAAPQVVAIYAFRPLGIAGRLMGLRVNLTDSFGLADPLAARIELQARGRPGHEKVFPAWWWAAKYATRGATQDARVALARRALDCGLLRELHDATHGELTLSRFFRNVALSFSLHRLRVPSEPAAAVERFCRS